jgi:hypothetical protein
MGNSHGSFIAGTQLLMISITADPLNKASGVLLVISSMAVIGKIGISPLGGISSVPAG